MEGALSLEHGACLDRNAAGDRPDLVARDGTGGALIYTAFLLVCGMADNVLKPLMLGRSVDVPVPVILVGAFGGMAADGIIGMFVGATLLALAWQLATGWVDENPDANSSSGASGVSDAASASVAAKASASRSSKARNVAHHALGRCRFAVILPRIVPSLSLRRLYKIAARGGSG
jgi:hypothetical protein